MKNHDLFSRSHLEKLSSMELIKLADEYGVDIPDDLSRQFIIGELLLLGEELEKSELQEETIVFSEGKQANANALPKSYNETKINLLLRNPASLFIWWDLNEALFKELESQGGALRLALYFFENGADEKPCDAFSIQLALEERKRYVIIPAGKKFARVDLMSECGGKTYTLAISQIISLPKLSRFMSLKPGEKADIPALMELSGAADFFHEHYNEYRQSFF